MEFRADLQDDHTRRIVRLAGRLEREQSGELVTLCDEARKPVRLDLTDLVSADTVGLEALAVLRSRGAELVGASPYIAMQLEIAETRRTREPPGGVVLERDTRGSRVKKARNTEDK
jgi:anti-anti-sigma regulatory factor